VQLNPSIGSSPHAVQYRQNAIIGDDNSVSGGLIGATSLLLVNYLVVRFLYDHKKLDLIVEDNADVLIENGQVRLERLKKEAHQPDPTGIVRAQTRIRIVRRSA